MLNSGRIELLDNDRLAAQIAGLERRTARGGRDSIDHPPNQHDDLANVACGLAVGLVARSAGGVQRLLFTGNGDPSAYEELRAENEKIERELGLRR